MKQSGTVVNVHGITIEDLCTATKLIDELDLTTLKKTGRQVPNWKFAPIKAADRLIGKMHLRTFCITDYPDFRSSFQQLSLPGRTIPGYYITDTKHLCRGYHRYDINYSLFNKTKDGIWCYNVKPHIRELIYCLIGDLATEKKLLDMFNRIWQIVMTEDIDKNELEAIIRSG